MSNKTLTIGLLVAVVIALGGYVFPKTANSLFGSSTACTDGYTCLTNLEIQGNEITDGTVTGNATTTSKNIVVTTSNTATSSIQVGCVQTYATSTATPINFSFTVSQSATSTVAGITGEGFVVWNYGKCPGV